MSLTYELTMTASKLLILIVCFIWVLFIFQTPVDYLITNHILSEMLCNVGGVPPNMYA